MAEEKLFIINLRREFIKKPEYKKSKKSITAIREYISKHMKISDVKIGKRLNEYIWKRGNKHPPPKVKVNAHIEDKIAYVELEGFKFEKIKEEKKEEEKKGLGKLLATKKEDKTKISEEEKKEEREELKELKKEVKKVDIIEKPDKGTRQTTQIKSKMKQQRGVNAPNKK